MTGRVNRYDNGQSINSKTETAKANRHGHSGTEPGRRERRLAAGTKFLLDFMFYGGIFVTLSLPLSIYWLGRYIAGLTEHYWALLIIYFILGIAATVLVNELRKIFRTVLAENSFVRENVRSLRRMGNVSFFIVIMSVVRSIVYLTIAMAVVIFVFIIAGLFSKVLAHVFEEAVQYKEENDMTI